MLTELREEGVVGTSSLHLSQTKAVGDLETHSLGLAGRGEDAGSRAKPLTASRQMVPDQVKAGPCWGRGNTLLLGGPHTWGRSASRAQCESRGAQGRAGDGLTRHPPGSRQHPLSLQAVWLLWPRWVSSPPWAFLWLWRTGTALYLCYAGFSTGGVSIYGEQVLLSTCAMRGSHWGRLYLWRTSAALQL